MMLLCVPAAAGKPVQQQLGQQQQSQPQQQAADTAYRRALRLFHEGKIGEADKVLRRSQTPPDAKVRILMARILYRQNDYKNAARQFSEFNPETLDATTVFEYGVSMYGAGKCTRALGAFVLLPRDYPRQNYARYYAAICYLKRGENAKALIKLKKATDLPSRFSTPRRQLILLARRALSSGRAISWSKIEEIASSRPQQAQKGGLPRKGFSFDFTPQLDLKLYLFQSNNHDLKYESGLTKESDVSIGIEPKYASVRPEGVTGPSFGLGLGGKAVNKWNDKKTRTLGATTDPNVLEWTTTEESGVAIHFREATVTPSLTIPLWAKSGLATKAEYWQRVDSNDKDNGDGQRRTLASALSSNAANLDLDAGVEYTENYDGKVVLREKLTTISGSLSRDWKIFDAVVSGSHLMRTVPVPSFSVAATESKASLGLTFPIDKAHLFCGAEYRHLTPFGDFTFVNWDKLDTTTLKGSLEYSFDFGLMIKVEGSAAFFSDYYIDSLIVGEFPVDRDTAVKSTGVAGGSSFWGGSTLSWQLWDVLTLSASGGITFNQYKLKDEAALTDFRQQNNKQKTDGTLAASLKKTF